MWLTDESESQIYKQVLRTVLRSQILLMVEQLAETGEESFVISANGQDDGPHISGSKQGLAYMQGFRGVLDGFPNFIQRNISVPEKKQTLHKNGIKEKWSIAKPIEDPVRSHPDFIESSHAKQFPSKLLFQPDGKMEEVSKDTLVDADFISEQLPTTSSELEKEVDKTRQNFIQERNYLSVTNEIPMEISEVRSQTDSLKIDIENNGTRLMPDLKRFDSEELSLEKTSDNNVIPFKTIAISEKDNEAKINLDDRLDEPDRVDTNVIIYPLSYKQTL